MSDDDEILQDFLVEAGEILEQLSEQLVDLERDPEDEGLLNAIFRGFHTVKGGAGFLQFDSMVVLCHVAENVFGLLRKRECKITPELMDTVLRALDSVNLMFDQIRSGEDITPADQDIIDNLGRIANGETAVAVERRSEPDLELQAKVVDASTVPATPAPSSSNGDIISDAEFEDLLDALQDKKASPKVVTENPSGVDDDIDLSVGDDNLFGLEGSSAADSDEITEEEFEALINDLQATGKSMPPSIPAPEKEPVVERIVQAAVQPTVQPTVKLAKASAPRAATPKGYTKADSAGEATVRVDTKRLDDIMNMVGELVLVRNRLVRLGTSSQDEEWSKAVSNLDVVTADLQSSVMKTRMQPIKKVFGRFPRVVRDLARNLDKEINLELVGEETDLDKNLVEALADPLVHLVRNSVDHGIELPADRVAAGKPSVGTITLSAQQEGDHILLVIGDDGKGMDVNALKKIAISKGVIDPDTADRMSDSEAFNLIFAPGFSTKEVISDISGRGVGMDVVKTKITQLNGTVDIESEMGKGSRVIIKVPLTLAIMPTLMVMLADQTFALPLVSVNEIFHLNLRETNVVDGQEVIIVRDKAVPLYYLSRWLVPAKDVDYDKDERHVVIVSVANQRVGFVVDQLIGQEEVVIKPLGKMLQGTDGMAGATITGDGRIALILDVPSMLKRYG